MFSMVSCNLFIDYDQDFTIINNSTHIITGLHISTSYEGNYKTPIYTLDVQDTLHIRLNISKVPREEGDFILIFLKDDKLTEKHFGYIDNRNLTSDLFTCEINEGDVQIIEIYRISDIKE